MAEIVAHEDTDTIPTCDDEVSFLKAAAAKKDQRRLAALLLKSDRRLSASVRVLADLFERDLSRYRTRTTELEARLARAYSEIERLRREFNSLLERKAGVEQAANAASERADFAEAKTLELQATLDRIEAERGWLPFRQPLHGLLWRARRLHWRVRRRIGAGRRRDMLRRSTLFNSDWYLEHYPDVRQAGLDPFEHYFLHGVFEMRDPGPGFSTSKYLARYPDVLVLEANPLEHYELVGRTQGREIFDADPPAQQTAPTGQPRRLRIVYVSGEAQTPGHAFRVVRYAEAARRLGCDVTVIGVDQLATTLDAIAACNLLVIWRAPWTDAVQAAMRAARAAGALVQYDTDDLMFEPELARVLVIDGIRSQGFSEEGTAALFGSVAQALMAADYGTAPTEFLVGRMRHLGKPAFVLPNGFDDTVWRNARLVVRERATHGGDGLVRIGYSAGTRTHQRDFAVVAGAIAKVLERRPQARLVLFRSGEIPIVELDEFPAFDGLRDQIEWREMVPVSDVVREMARYDISIAPIEVGNPFCEAKSELKFFESALVEVPFVASPSGPFREAIDPGHTGSLPADETEWIEALLELVDDKALRARIGRAAYLSVLWRYGTEARVECMRSLLAQVAGDPPEAALAFELDLNRRRYARPVAPRVPPHRVEVLREGAEIAQVTVILPLRNGAKRVIEALDSVHDQTLDRLDLIVIDDCSTDNSWEIARAWMLGRMGRFNRAMMIRNDEPSGLGSTRNVGFANAETQFVAAFEPDGKLLPNFAARCLEVAERSTAAFVCPIVRSVDGGDEGTIGTQHYSAARLAAGNDIDAIALIRLAAWAAVGGYEPEGVGSGHFDFWCRFAERGLFGQHLPEVLAMRQPRSGPMPRTGKEPTDHDQPAVAADFYRRHPWVQIGLAPNPD